MLISSELEVSFNHLIKLMLCERYSIVYGLPYSMEVEKTRVGFALAEHWASWRRHQGWSLRKPGLP